MNQPLRITELDFKPTLHTILSDLVTIPLVCDHCQHTTDYSLKSIKQQEGLMCEHCYHVRTISHTELVLLQAVLAKAGYHFANDTPTASA